MIDWLLQALVGVTLVMILVLALRRPVAHFLGAEWAYALWLLLPLRLILPPFAMPKSPLLSLVSTSVANRAPPADLAAIAFDSTGLMAAMWLGGAALYLSWQQSSYSAFLLHLGSEGRRGDPPEFGGIRVVASDAVEGPMAVGIWRRRIVVPLDFATRYSPAEQQLALEHELVHHRRFDILWNLTALLLLALNWFNPIAYLAFRAFREDQELACDAAVARRRPQSRGDYARALVKSASQSGLLTAAPLNHADFLKSRLRMMNRHGGGWQRAVGGIAAVAAATVAGLVLSGPGEARAEPEPPALQLASATSAAMHGDMASAQAPATAVQGCGHDQADPKGVRDDPVGETPPTPIRMAAAAPEQPAGSAMSDEPAFAEAEEQFVDTGQSRAGAAEILVRARSEAAGEEPIATVRAREALARARVRLAESNLRSIEFAELHSATATPGSLVAMRVLRRYEAEEAEDGSDHWRRPGSVIERERRRAVLVLHLEKEIEQAVEALLGD